MPISSETILIREFEQLQDYQTILQAMRDFTQRWQLQKKAAEKKEAAPKQIDEEQVVNQANIKETKDEFWLLQHFPVFTQGTAGKSEHILKKTSIPVVQSDRGGQVTYHGPGQIIVYFMMNIERKKLTIKQLVYQIEAGLISLLSDYGIKAHRKEQAPGVYVNHAKIGSIGLRIRQGWSYHGLSFNVDCDLDPFAYINPCGFSGLKMTRLRDLIGPIPIKEVQTKLISSLAEKFQFNDIQYIGEKNGQ